MEVKLIFFLQIIIHFIVYFGDMVKFVRVYLIRCEWRPESTSPAVADAVPGHDTNSSPHLSHTQLSTYIDGISCKIPPEIHLKKLLNAIGY